MVTRDVYGTKAADPDRERITLKRRPAAVDEQPRNPSAQAEVSALTGGRGSNGLRCRHDTTKREVLAGVLCNLSVEDGHIGSYQWKGPFELLEMDASGAFIHSWWAM